MKTKKRDRRNIIVYVLIGICVVLTIMNLGSFFFQRETMCLQSYDLSSQTDFYFRELPDWESSDLIEDYDFVCEEVCLYKVKENKTEDCPHEICSCSWKDEWAGVPSSEWDSDNCNCISTEKWKQEHCK